jgi:hypothetical protein
VEALCATVAGASGHAEALEELREALFELVADLPEHGRALCATVAGGCGHAEALEELGEVLFVVSVSVVSVSSTHRAVVVLSSAVDETRRNEARSGERRHDSPHYGDFIGGGKGGVRRLVTLREREEDRR